MRKDKRNTTATPELARVQSYHAGGGGRREAYAFAGFAENLYYTSDRVIKLTGEFRRPDGKPLKGYGLEIETECSGVRNETVLAEVFDKIIFAQFPAKLFKMQHDISLGGDTSAECITQIMTKEAIRNMYPAFRTMYKTYFPAFGISAASTHCGMHVNISLGCFGTTDAAQEEAVRKLYYFVNRNFGMCCRLFCRDAAATHYCGRMPYENARTMDMHGFYTDHSVCFNLGHYDAGRVEIRLVGGQPSYGAFRNTMETVFHLVDAVKRISWGALEAGDVVQVFKGCNQYVYDRISTLAAEFFAPEQLVEIAANIKTEELV